MTLPLYHAVGGQWLRSGRTTIAPPAAPTGLVATAGDRQASLSWTPSATGGVTYQVRRDGATTPVWSGSGTTATVTGLTNGTEYAFQVFAVAADGTLSGPSNAATATPAAVVVPPSTATIFGYNWNNKDTAAQTIAGRKAWFNGRVPCVRVYGSTLDGTFPVTAATAQEGRVCWSFKAGGKYTAAQLGSSPAARADMIKMFEAIPAGWTVFPVYHHEPNSSSGMEVNPPDFLATYHQLMQAKAAANLKPGVQVFITCNFMAFELSTIQTNMHAWIPPRSDCDIFTWDLYLNPGTNTSSTGSNKYGGPATGSAYGTTYPLLDPRTKLMWDITEAMGYADSFGFLEINAPARDWDTGEAGRVAAHLDLLAMIQGGHGMAGGHLSKICLLWEAPSGAKWDQTYGRLSKNPAPMVNVWKPYITGVPVGKA